MNNSIEVSHNTIRNQQNNSDVLANIIENTLNIIRNIKNTIENMKNRIDKQHNKIPNLILAVITPHNGDRTSIGVGAMIWANFSIFRTNCAIACGTRAYIAARIFADVAQGKWRSKFPKSFMLLAHNSRPLWKLEFCLRISP